MRLLQYFAEVSKKIVDKKYILRRKLRTFPIPEFIVLYNGTDPFPPEKELRLSDAFQAKPGKSKNGGVELTVRVVNINVGQNEEIVNQCVDLHGYVTLIQAVRDGLKAGLKLKEAIQRAVKYCINQHILEDYLRKYSAEVMDMPATEFDLELLEG